jgi:hypothetical protein
MALRFLHLWLLCLLFSYSTWNHQRQDYRGREWTMPRFLLLDFLHIPGRTGCYRSIIEQSHPLDLSAGEFLLLLGLPIQFQVAKTLCHEIGHTLQITIFGFWHHARLGRLNEVLYKNPRLAEGGYQLEAELFGGIIFNSGAHTGLVNSQSYPLACGAGR